jgi:hypothetical protein
MVHYSPSMPYGSGHICAKQTGVLEKSDKRALNRYEGQPPSLFSGINLEPPPGAQCVGGGTVLRFTCRFGGWKHHTRQLDPPVGLPPQHPWSVNGIQRKKATSADIDYLQHLFPACQVGRAPPWTACRATQPPHGDGRSSCRHFQTPGRLCQTKVIQKQEYQPKRACKEPSRQ